MTSKTSSRVVRYSPEKTAMILAKRQETWDALPNDITACDCAALVGFTIHAQLAPIWLPLVTEQLHVMTWKNAYALVCCADTPQAHLVACLTRGKNRWLRHISRSRRRELESRFGKLHLKFFGLTCETVDKCMSRTQFDHGPSLQQSFDH